jgi:hypothetical protein
MESLQNQESLVQITEAQRDKLNHLIAELAKNVSTSASSIDEVEAQLGKINALCYELKVELHEVVPSTPHFPKKPKF